MITTRTKLFAILWLAGLLGVLSILLIDLSAVLANLPGAAGSEMPFHPLLIKLLSIVQPTILLSIAVFIGFQLAHRVGLSAPAAEALARGNSFISALKPQVLPGVIAGFIAGVAILSTWVLFRPILPTMFVTRAERLNSSMPLFNSTPIWRHHRRVATPMGITDAPGMGCMADISKRPWYTASNLLCKRDRDFVSRVRNWPFATCKGTRS